MAFDPPADNLPTPRSLAPTGFRMHVWCKACGHAKDADLDALIRQGKGDIPPGAHQMALRQLWIPAD
jgi:hypothetical protein